jgi:hypothetical protein
MLVGINDRQLGHGGVLRITGDLPRPAPTARGREWPETEPMVE